jgi:phage-related protein
MAYDNLHFNGPQSVFLQDSTLEGIVWNWTNNQRVPVYPGEILKLSYGTRSDPQVTVDRLAFGDGYEQITESGIRPVKLKFNVIFGRQRPAVVRALIRFFTGEYGTGTIYDRRPSSYFYFKVPYPWDDENAQPRKFICLNFPMEPQTFHSNNVTATFEEVFQP